MYGYEFIPQWQNRPQMPQNQLVRVTGIDGAKAFQMMPNSMVALFDSTDDVFYIKTTDGANFPTIKAFRFEPIETQTATPEYVTRAEFEALKEAINGK